MRACSWSKAGRRAIPMSRLMRFVCACAVCLMVAAPIFGQKKPFHVLAFYSTTVEQDHVDFAIQAIPFFQAMAAKDGFEFKTTKNWNDMNAEVLSHALGHTSTATYQDIRARWGKGDVTPGHGVIFYENLRLPALFYPWTGNREDLQATRGALAWHDRTQLLPIGVSSSEEFHAAVGATRNVETCNVAASIWTYLWLLRITGEGDFSDRIEKVFFNAGPAPVARDFQTMCYYQSPNRYSEANPGQEPENPGAQSYRFTRTGHEVLCCVGNLNRVIPNYAMHMWMATLDGGLAATLYGPSMVRARVAGGVEARLEAKTNYPFEDSIRLAVSTGKPARFPLHLRLPGWCRQPQVRINGRAVNLAQEQPGQYFVPLAGSKTRPSTSC